MSSNISLDCLAQMTWNNQVRPEDLKDIALRVSEAFRTEPHLESIPTLIGKCWQLATQLSHLPSQREACRVCEQILPHIGQAFTVKIQEDSLHIPGSVMADILGGESSFRKELDLLDIARQAQSLGNDPVKEKVMNILIEGIQGLGNSVEDFEMAVAIQETIGLHTALVRYFEVFFMQFTKIEDLAAFLEKHGSKVTVLNLSEFYTLTDESFEQLTRHCPNLAHLLAMRGYKLTDRSMEALSRNCPRVQTLILDSWQVTAQGLAPLAQLKFLEKLSILYFKNLDKDLCLEAISKVSTLRELDISMPLTEAGASYLAQLTRLEKLRITGRFTCQNFPFLPHLRNLDIAGFSWGKDEDLHSALLADIARLTSLEELNLQGRDLPPEALALLSGLTNLRKLDLHQTNATGGTITNAHLAALGLMQRLEELHLGGNRYFSREGLVHLPKTLRILILNSCSQLEDGDLDAVGQLSNLQTLELGQCYRITNRGVESLGRLTNLRRLHLGGCDLLTEECLPFLPPAIVDLWLDGCLKITDQGLNHLSRLVFLESFNLWNCRHITTLDPLAKLTRLRRLQIKGYLGNGLGFLRSLPHLRTFDLITSGTITKEDLTAIAHQTDLRNLILIGDFTDETLAQLTSLQRLTSLSLQEAPHLTTASWTTILQLPSLRSILIRNCGKFETQDTPQLELKAKGIELSH